ncbi:hypothetical protein L1987_85995 [Smallanthus sonchifolius]|uniref:Uncharacterized protein n=1 Tax=Smallanthus sonchifolius TaxID=185202 RepID=A0ACB8XXE0_9ASTR|nr:hypothetical protein L1987_85995 [Smallanthus sonchifolius]
MPVYDGVRRSLWWLSHVCKEEVTMVMEVHVVDYDGRNSVPNKEDNLVIGYAAYYKDSGDGVGPMRNVPSRIICFSEGSDEARVLVNFR